MAVCFRFKKINSDRGRNYTFFRFIQDYLRATVHWVCIDEPPICTNIDPPRRCNRKGWLAPEKTIDWQSQPPSGSVETSKCCQSRPPTGTMHHETWILSYGPFLTLDAVAAKMESKSGPNISLTIIRYWNTKKYNTQEELSTMCDSVAFKFAAL